jgi:predicted alpha/beta-fold hydrolase
MIIYIYISMTSGVIKLAIGSVIILATRCICYKIECAAIFPSKKLKKDHNFNLYHHEQILNTNKSNPTTLQEYFVKTKDGETINVIYFHNPNVKGHTIFAHGNAGTIESRIDMIHTLADHTSVVLFDYRGYGKSSGKSTEKGLYQDVYAVWKFLVNNKNIDPRTITLYGRSLGSSVVAHLGSRLCDKDLLKPNAVIMESGFSSIKNVAKELISNKITYIMRSNFDSQNHVKKIGDKIPLLIAHSPDDELIKYYHKDQLIKSSNSHNTYFYQLSGGHNDPVMNYDYISTLRMFIVD